jgi:lambda repressor-like predicted transcriptional regulator
VTDTSSAVLTLQSDWHTLQDLDRARAVNAINKAGISLRQLAKALNCSPSLLRHLLDALQAPPEDRYLAHQGNISTNELCRRAKAAGIRRTARQRESLQLERTQASVRGCRTICDWLAEENISAACGEQIVEEARRELVNAEERNQLPLDAAPPDMPVVEIIQRCRPAEPKTDAVSFVAWFAYWLALWAAYAMTDSWVRYQAIELALERQSRR